MLTKSLMLAALLATPHALAGEHVVRLPADASGRVAVKGGRVVAPVTAGLSLAQRAALKTLTAGAFDLDHLYRVELGAEAPRPAGYMGSIGEVLTPFAPLRLGEGPRLEQADPDLENQWWMRDLNTREAWAYATGKGVTIADCDTGFYTSEGDLEPNLLIDRRRDFADKEKPHAVADGRIVFHGTAVAAIMVGARDGIGTNGIAYDAKLVPLQNFNYDAALDDIDKEEATAACVLHALENDAVDVIVVQNQTTMGSSETHVATRSAIALAIKSGVAVVSAAGNSSRPLVVERENDTGSIIVGALRQNGGAANFSNYGPRVTVAAFGENLHTLYGPAGRMDTFGGTTGAAAQVGGAVALMLEANPYLQPLTIRRILMETRRTTPSNREVGGQLDVLAAVKAAAVAQRPRAEHKAAKAFRAKVRTVLSAP